jgi:hypothetical protein
MGNVLDAIAGAVARVHNGRGTARRPDWTAHLATKWTTESVIAAAVEAVSRRTSTASGLEEVWHVVADTPVMSADLSRPQVRRQVTDWLLGSERAAVESYLARDLGIDGDSLGSLLEAVVGVYLTHLRRRTALEHLDNRGLRRIIVEEQQIAGESIEIDVPNR